MQQALGAVRLVGEQLPAALRFLADGLSERKLQVNWDKTGWLTGDAELAGMLALAWEGELERASGLRCLGGDGSTGVLRSVVEQNLRLEKARKSAERVHVLRAASARVEKDLLADRAFVLEAVSRDGHALRHASPALRADRAVVAAAARRSPGAVAHAAAALLEEDAELRALLPSSGAGSRRGWRAGPQPHPQVKGAEGLPADLANDVRVDYNYFIDEKPYCVGPVHGHGCNPEFGYQKTFVQDPVTSRFLEYLQSRLVF
ncbi:unnamed protein product, partial [Prorocentrum cordatum]